MLLTLREYEEILLHLQHDPFRWMRSEQNPNMWLRAPEGVSTYAILFAEQEEAETVAVDVYADRDEEAQTWQDHFERLLTTWTGFGRRAAVGRLLGDEELAWKISTLEVRPSPEDALPARTEEASRMKTFRFDGGGYLLLVQRGDEVQATLSVPRFGEQSYDTPLIGFLRAQDGRTRDVAAAILEEDPVFAPPAEAPAELAERTDGQ